MNYYTVCPSCGYKLLKAGEGSIIEVICPKCSDKINIEIKDNKVVIMRTLSSKIQDNT